MGRFLTVSLVVILLAACGAPPDDGGPVTGSDFLVRIPLDLDGFTRIEANHGAQVSVEHGEFRVELQVNDNLEPYLDVRLDGDTLYIGLEERSYTGITFQAQVTMPELAGVTLDGGSAFRAEVTGQEFTLGLNGASIAIVGGAVRNATIVADGSSQALLSDLAATDVQIDADGGSRVQIQATGTVRGIAKGASTVTVTGSPLTVDVETDGASTVNHE